MQISSERDSELQAMYGVMSGIPARAKRWKPRLLKSVPICQLDYNQAILEGFEEVEGYAIDAYANLHGDFDFKFQARQNAVVTVARTYGGEKPTEVLKEFEIIIVPEEAKKPCHGRIFARRRN